MPHQTSATGLVHVSVQHTCKRARTNVGLLSQGSMRGACRNMRGSMRLCRCDCRAGMPVAS